jgi:hypothetical protein
MEHTPLFYIIEYLLVCLMPGLLIGLGLGVRNVLAHWWQRYGILVKAYYEVYWMKLVLIRPGNEDLGPDGKLIFAFCVRSGTHSHRDLLLLRVRFRQRWKEQCQREHGAVIPD